MDKVNNSNRQAMPRWERQTQKRGHRSAVDGALRAHRQRAMERHSRTQDRLDMVKQLSSDFFPAPHVQQRNEMENLQAGIQPDRDFSSESVVKQNQDFALLEMDEMKSFIPQSMDEIYSEAQLATTSDNAMSLVQKDLSNPEDGPVDDVPRGSYIDYQV